MKSDLSTNPKVHSNNDGVIIYQKNEPQKIAEGARTAVLHELQRLSPPMRNNVSTIFSFSYILPKREVPIQKYLQIFLIIVKNFVWYGGEFDNHPAVSNYVLEQENIISEYELDEVDASLKQIQMKRTRDQFLALSFLLGGTCSKCRQLVADLPNSYILGVD